MSQGDDCIGAVDIGGTKIAVGFVTRQGTVLSQRSFPTASTAGWRGGVEAIATALNECHRETGLEMKTVGIGCTGPVNPLSGIVGRVALLPGWEGCPLTTALAELTGADVTMENDADAAALGEFAWGSGRGARRFLYVTVSTGIGTGFICNGELYRGAEGAHPEMGHHTIDSLGPLCYCGARGCWESLASGTAIERRFSELRRNEGVGADWMNARSIFELAQGRDVTACSTIERFLHDLGTGLANVTTMLVPDVIALGGGVMQSMTPYLEMTRQFVKRTCGEVSFHGTSIRLAELEDRVGLVGAAAVAIARWM
jgi:glucokinase